MTLLRPWRFACVFLVALVYADQASSATIGFDNELVNGAWSGPQIEDGFTYELLEGELWAQVVLLPTWLNGNPLPYMQGRASAGGGTLGLTRADGGVFTFDAVDVAWHKQSGPFRASESIEFSGYLEGEFIASDQLETFSSHNVWRTVASSNLAGLAIDELRVRLDATNSINGPWESIDNIVVSAVPEPGTASLVAMGLIALRVHLRRSRGRQSSHRIKAREAV